ncbi:MAG: DUF4443 domain-containing protein [Candidatus Nitrosothermus koennekii]|nr:MAG: DUF4443 domain-containing protein [Candidatus Nitrosothermus koennekii]
MKIEVLMKVASRYAPSRVLSFELVHVFKALQLMHNTYASRALLSKELGLGEGSIKTLLKHMKMYDLIESSRKGSRLTRKGCEIYEEIRSIITDECELSRSSIALGRFNYAILLKDFSKAIKFGIEQRDAAIKVGALGATTLIYKDGKFTMPKQFEDTLSNDKHTKELLMNLKPEDNDVIIIGSADDKLIAELGAKNAGLMTIDYMNRVSNI